MAEEMAAQPQEQEQVATPEETTPDLTAELEKERAARVKAEEIANNQRIRAEKAEKARTIEQPSESSSTQPKGLSIKDTLYLAKADIHADDVGDVLTYAEKMGVSVSEAHKFFKPILAARSEERKTASTTQTKGGRGSAKATGEDLLRKAESTGEVPETDEGLRELAEARMARRIAKRQ